MSEMIERVARAICAAYGRDPDAPFVDHHGKATDFPEWERWQGEAGAAIKAMREPDEVMIQRAYEAVEFDDRWQIEDGRDFLKAYHAVIDAARG